MRFLLTLTLLSLMLAHARAASLAQAVLYTTDTSGTNARPSAVTITPSTSGTNLNAGVLNATNDVRLNGTSIVIWTNSAGTISATSTNGLAYQNLGTNVFQVFPNGGIFTGPSTSNWWSIPPDGEALVTYYDYGIGEPYYVEIDGYANNSVTGGVGYYKLDVESHVNGKSLFQLVKTDGLNQFVNEMQVNLAGFPDIYWRSFTTSGGPDTTLFQFRPTPTGTATAYIFNTLTNRTVGKLVDVQNDDITKASILYNGNLSISGETNQLSVAGDVLKLDGTPVEPWVDIRTTGAVVDGATDDSAAIQAAIDAVSAGGGTVFFPAGTAKMNSGVTNTSNTQFVFDAGSVIDATGVANSTILFKATGNEAAGVLLTANALRGTLSVSVAAGAEAAFAAGDWVKIGATNYWTPNTTADSSMDQKVGEIAIVDSTSSGTIVLKEPLHDDYLTVNEAFIAKLTMCDNISFSGPVKIIGKGTGSSVSGIQMDYCTRIRIDGLQLVNFDDAHIRFKDTIDARVSGVTIYGGTSAASTFYGFNCMHACQDVVFYGNFVDSTRHSITLGGNTSRAGINRRITYSNNTVINTTATAIDSHAGADGFLIIGNTVMNPIGSGIAPRCPSVIIMGNWIYNPGTNQSGIAMMNQSTNTTRAIIKGNHIECNQDSRNISAIQVRDHTLAALDGTDGGRFIDAVVVEGNTIITRGGTAITIQSDETWPMRNITVANNNIRSAQASNGRAILAKNAVNCTFENNIMTDLGSTTDGYKFDTCAFLNVTGGLIEWESAPSAEYGFQGVASTNINVSGITITRANKPASLDNNCANWTFSASVASQTCTGDYSLGTGAGNSAPVYASRTWATVSGLTPAVGTIDYASDLGSAGTMVVYAGSRWKPINGRATLNLLGAPVSGVNNTYSIVLQTQVPANAWKNNDVIRLTLEMNKSGAVDSAALGVFVGTAGTTADTAVINGSTMMGATGRTWTGFIDLKLLSATTVLKVGSATGSLGVGNSTSAAITSATTITDASANALYVTVAIKSSGTTDTVGIDHGAIELLTP